MIEIRANKNGATSRIDYARQFKAQNSSNFNCSLFDVIQTIISYEKMGMFEVTETEIILYHEC